jgi:hypothetical protein
VIFIFSKWKKKVVGFSVAKFHIFSEKKKSRFYIKFQKLDKNIEGRLIVFTFIFN